MQDIDTTIEPAARSAGEKPKKRPRRRFVIILLVLLLGGGAVAAGYYGALYYRSLKEQTDNAAFYAWEGDYIDTSHYLTTMSITAQARKDFYDVTVCMGDENDSDVILWTFTAVYNKVSNTLVYSDAVRKDIITTDGEDASLVTEQVYTGGAGYLEVKGGNIFWTDNEENYGKGLIFDRT